MNLGGTEVVVSGMGALTAFGAGRQTLLRALERGISAIREPTQPELLTLPAAAELHDFSLDSALRGLDGCPETLTARCRRVAPRAPRSLDASIFAAVEAWLDAGLASRPVPAERIALVIAGSNLSQAYQLETMRRFASDLARTDARYALRFLDTDQVGVISELLEIRAEGFTVGGASASGNVAITNALRLLRQGHADLCLVVGALSDLSQLEIAALQNVGALATGGGRTASEVCRPFDRDRCGFVLGQAAACLVLETRGSAQRRGATAYARLSGASVSLAGSHLPAPDVDSEARAMRQALDEAALTPSQVDYVNAHATSSLVGDEAEIQALRTVFGAHLPSLWVNSSKGLTGHCLSAAGVLEAVASILQLNGGFVHANVNLLAPLTADCRFAAGSAEQVALNTVLSNSFGFGGISSSIVLQRA